jgi:hypothetical protein
MPEGYVDWRILPENTTAHHPAPASVYDPDETYEVLVKNVQHTLHNYAPSPAAVPNMLQVVADDGATYLASSQFPRELWLVK